MYLAEAIREKDFVAESIKFLCNRIKELSVSSHESDIKLNQELVKNKVKELENLYKEFQKYSIIISRAKVIATIKLNDEDFSIADAESILESVRDRLGYFEDLLSNINIESNRSSQTNVCVNVEDIYTKIYQLRSDVRTIENSIERVLWATEV